MDSYSNSPHTPSSAAAPSIQVQSSSWQPQVTPSVTATCTLTSSLPHIITSPGIPSSRLYQSTLPIGNTMAHGPLSIASVPLVHHSSSSPPVQLTFQPLPVQTSYQLPTTTFPQLVKAPESVQSPHKPLSVHPAFQPLSLQPLYQQPVAVPQTTPTLLLYPSLFVQQPYRYAQSTSQPLCILLPSLQLCRWHFSS